jgi:hypothetical protein
MGIDPPTHLVPRNDRPEDTLIELLQFASTIFGALIVGFGHIEISLRVGDAFCG